VKNILLIGGTGFVGSALAARLATADFSITLAARRPERVRHLAVLPSARLIAADVHDEATLARLMAGQDVVVNLVGILRGNFQRAHVDLPGKIAHAATAAAVPRLIHVSALAAGPDAPSIYLRSKAAGETAVKSACPGATIFRPSVIFGRGDSFLTLFARLLTLAPVVPLACADARFQPVWVQDVVSAILAAITRPESAGQTLPLCGPREYTLRQLVAYAGEVSGHPRTIIGLPHAMSYLQALMMEFVPGGPMTRDNLRSMQVPNVCPDGCTLPFGLEPTPMEAVVPGYLS